MKRTIIECDRCAQHPLDPRRIETIGVTQAFARRIAGEPAPPPATGDAPHYPDPPGVIDLCPKCQEAFVQFMKGPAAPPWPER